VVRKDAKAPRRDYGIGTTWPRGPSPDCSAVHIGVSGVRPSGWPR